MRRYSLTLYGARLRRAKSKRRDRDTGATPLARFTLRYTENKTVVPSPLAEPARVITEQAIREIAQLLPPRTFLHRYLTHVEKQTDSHLAYHLAAGLAVLTQTCPRQLSLHLGSSLYAHGFFLCVGPSGMRKTIAVMIGRRVVSDGEGEIEGAVPNSVLANDIASAEGVSDLLRDRSRFMVCYDEFGDFLLKTSQPHFARLKTLLNGLADASPQNRILIKGRFLPPNENSKNPRVSVLAACADEYLKTYTRPVDWTGGFFSRWIVFYPTDQPREFVTPPQFDEKERRQLVAYLRIKEGMRMPGVLASSAKTADAEAIWQEWYGRLKATRAMLTSELAQTVLRRADTHALRIAMLLAWDLGEACRPGWLLSANALVPALRIANLHIRSVCKIIDEIPHDEEAAERRKVLETIAEDHPTSRAKVLQTTQISSYRLRNHTKTLVEGGYIRQHVLDEHNISFQKLPERPKPNSYAELDLWDPLLDREDTHGAENVHFISPHQEQEVVDKQVALEDF